MNTYVNRKVRRLPCVPTRTAVEVFLDYLRTHTPEREQKVMAAHAGISETTFSRWMSGRQVPNPTLSTLEKLARAYRTSIASLVSDVGPPQLPPEKQAALDLGEELMRRATEALRKGTRG